MALAFDVDVSVLILLFVREPPSAFRATSPLVGEEENRRNCDDLSFGHEPAEDARKIAQILFDVIEAVGQLPEDITDDIGFRVAGHLAAVRMRD